MAISRYNVNWRTAVRNIVLEIATALSGLAMTDGMMRKKERDLWWEVP